MQETFHDPDAGGDQLVLEAVDDTVTARPYLGWHELAHAGHQDILVMRAVEDADDARRWELAPDAPQEVVLALSRRGLGERVVAHAHRVDQAQNMLDGAPLTSGVHTLQHEQHAAPTAEMPLGVELRLQLGQGRLELAYRRLGVRLARAGEARRCLRGDTRNARRASGEAQQVTDSLRVPRSRCGHW